MITNIRLGFATNSSSTHSIVIKKPNHKIEDEYDKHYFGWDFFTAASSKAKDRYLGALVFQHLRGYVGWELAKDLCGLWFKGFNCNVTVDHQSCPLIPRGWEETGIDKQFVLEYREFLQNPNLVILGGNDNTDEEHPLTTTYPPFVIPSIGSYSKRVVARKDEELGFWTLFDRENGTKLRMTFSEHQPTITRSSVPELVDLKITDFCNFGCKFCYQGSTPQGKHADISYLRKVIYALGELKVLEVAIGGGEPTLYPEFLEVLRLCHYQHIVPNFTTKNLAWLKDDETRECYLDLIGGFAYSCTSYHQAKELTKLIEKYDLPRNKIQIQVVEGTLDNFTLKEILKLCSWYNINLTILGFKEIERGKTYRQIENDDNQTWLDIVKKCYEKEWYVNVGIDTCMARKYQDKLVKEGIPRISYHVDEGKFSCYIDGCQEKMGPSSYEPERMVDLKHPYRDETSPIQTIFNSFSY